MNTEWSSLMLVVPSSRIKDSLPHERAHLFTRVQFSRDLAMASKQFVPVIAAIKRVDQRDPSGHGGDGREG
jgi:hypothetical protein